MLRRKRLYVLRTQASYNNFFFLLRKGNDHMNFLFLRNLYWLQRRNFVIEKEDLLSKLLMDLDFSFKADVIG